MSIKNEQFISIDTNQTIMEEADTLMEEYEQQKIDQLNQRMAELEASNAELLEALKDCCVIARPKNPSSCCPAYRPGVHGGCAENEDCECNIWKAIQKAKEERQ